VGLETRKLQGLIFLVRVAGSIRSPRAAERSMVRPATVKRHMLCPEAIAVHRFVGGSIEHFRTAGVFD